MRKIYMILEKKTDELYAWTENKSLAKLFVAMRKPDYFKIKKKTIDDADEYELWKYQIFMNDHRGLQLTQNVLGRTRKDTIDFPTTYYENTELETRCDKLYDEFIEISKSICALPLTDSMRETIEYMTWLVTRDGGKHVHFDTFAIFAELFKETLL